MSFCTAIIKSSNKNCSSKAKYFLTEYNKYFCKVHALMHSNIILNTQYESIDDIPNLQEIGYQIQLSDNSLKEIFTDIYQIHNYKLTEISTIKNKKIIEIIVINLNDITEKYILKIVKAPVLIDSCMNISSSYASLLSRLTKLVCVPIISYKKDDQICLVRGWKYNHWYYELSLPSYPLLMNNNKKLLIRLLELIELSHSYRIIHGSIELRNLVQIKEKRISTTVFESLKNALFWEGRYGQTIDEDTTIDSDINFDSNTCARRLNQKSYPCRYDDYESLLFLMVQLLGETLPWIGLSDAEIVIEKNNYLLSLIDNKKMQPIAEIANIIMNSHYDDRPNYDKLSEYFSQLIV